MNETYLTLEEILRLHFQLIEDFGGTHGIRDESRLLSVIEAPKQVVFGEVQYQTLFEKAAIYLRNIIGDHPFTDGNKRTAVTVCGIFLMRNNILFTAVSKELEDFAVVVAAEHWSAHDIAVWLGEHSRRHQK